MSDNLTDGRLATQKRKLTDRKQNLQGRVGFFQIYHPLVQAGLAVLRLVVRFETSQFVFLQPAESEDNVGAEVRLNVLRQELADLRAILRPIRVVAHELWVEKIHVEINAEIF